MNLNELAESDLEHTLEDAEAGFGVSLIFYDDLQNEVEINCQTTDINFFIDPDTGMGVSGRTVEIACRISTIENNNITIQKGSIVLFYDTAGNEYKSNVKIIRPDRKLGVYNLLLEAKE